MPRKRPLAERLWEKVERPSMWDCWIWTAAADAAGYGRIGDRLRTLRAHRVAYELLVGPIPEGLVLDHLCRTPACVNPLHVEPVTQGENVRRGNAGWNFAVRQSSCERGHFFDDANVYVTPDGRRNCRTCRRDASRRYQRRRKSLAA